MANSVNIRNPSRLVILWLVWAVNSRTTVEPISMKISIILKLSGVTVPKRATGKPRTIQILKILLPIILPTRSPVSPRLAALMVVMSSGSEVPKATTVSEMMRSVIPMVLAIVEAELTTSSAPPTTPARPTKMSRSETPSLNLGSSIALLLLFLISLRFLRAVEKM